MYRQKCLYYVTGGITNVKKPSSFYRKGRFFLFYRIGMSERLNPIKQKNGLLYVLNYTKRDTGGKNSVPES